MTLLPRKSYWHDSCKVQLIFDKVCQYLTGLEYNNCFPWNKKLDRITQLPEVLVKFSQSITSHLYIAFIWYSSDISATKKYKNYTAFYTNARL